MIPYWWYNKIHLRVTPKASYLVLLVLQEHFSGASLAAFSLAPPNSVRSSSCRGWGVPRYRHSPPPAKQTRSSPGTANGGRKRRYPPITPGDARRVFPNLQHTTYGEKGQPEPCKVVTPSQTAHVRTPGAPFCISQSRDRRGDPGLPLIWLDRAAPPGPSQVENSMTPNYFLTPSKACSKLIGSMFCNFKGLAGSSRLPLILSISLVSSGVSLVDANCHVDDERARHYQSLTM